MICCGSLTAAPTSEAGWDIWYCQISFHHSLSVVPVVLIARDNTENFGNDRALQKNVSEYALFEHLFIPMQAMQAITVCLPLQKVVKRIIRDKQLWKNIPVSLSG